MDSPTRYLDVETWVRTWIAAGPRLDAIRASEIASVDLADFLRSMVDAFKAAQASAEPRTTSGLVTQQRLFRRLIR